MGRRDAVRKDASGKVQQKVVRSSPGKKRKVATGEDDLMARLDQLDRESAPDAAGNGENGEEGTA